MNTPSQLKLMRQPSERDRGEALPCKFGTESKGELQGCGCECWRAPHQCTPSDVPSDTAPDSHGPAYEPHGLQVHCLMQHSLLLDIDEYITCTWGEMGFPLVT